MSFLLLSSIVFLIGGSLQFYVGFSNTILSFLLLMSLNLIYVNYALAKGKILFTKLILASGMFAMVIIITACLTHSDVISTLVYLIFPLMPISVYLFFHINKKEQIISFKQIFKLYLFVGLIQFPVLLLQKNLYSFLIRFNQSGQQIESTDFMFGTFFIKSDHTLGVFLLLLIATILYRRNEIKGIVRSPEILVGYLLLTLFLTESNISKLLAVIVLSFTVIARFYRKYGRRLMFKIATGFFVCCIGFLGYNLRNTSIIQSKLGGSLSEQLSVEKALKVYELRTAKRFQIVVVAFKKLKTKWMGDGPYSYFDIRSGMFKNAPHFSQLIWTYFDLGVLGLLVFLYFLWELIKQLSFGKGIIRISLFLGFLLISFYTTVLSDFGILLSAFGLLGFLSGKGLEMTER
jgi:hypothetical protein